MAEVEISDSDDENETGSRKSWQKQTDLTSLENKTLLAQTAQNSNTIKPKANDVDKLIKLNQFNSPRKNWDSPHQTVIKALENADIALLNTENQPFESNSDRVDQAKPLNSTLKRGQTFIIDKKTNERRVASSSDHPEANKNIVQCSNGGNEEKTTSEKQSFDFTNISPLRATQNIMLEITQGKFDPVNTKMLRTCSEPDLAKLNVETKQREEKRVNQCDDDDDLAIDDDDCVYFKKSAFKSGTLRLAVSLEKIINDDDDQEEMAHAISKSNENANNNSSKRDSSTATASSKKQNDDPNEIDDLSEVGEAMRSFLLGKKKRKTKKKSFCIEFLSLNKFYIYIYIHLFINKMKTQIKRGKDSASSRMSSPKQQMRARIREVQNVAYHLPRAINWCRLFQLANTKLSTTVLILSQNRLTATMKIATTFH